MNVKIIHKKYGKGRDRIVLVDKATGLGFVSFGIKDPPYNYLMDALKRETKNNKQHENIT